MSEGEKFLKWLILQCQTADHETIHTYSMSGDQCRTMIFELADGDTSTWRGWLAS